MAYEVRPNTGTLFKNDKKDSDTHPDYKGNGIIDGVEYWFDAWINTPKGGGDKYMSLKFKPKDAQQGGAQPTRQPASQFDDDDTDGIPF